MQKRDWICILEQVIDDNCDLVDRWTGPLQLKQNPKLGWISFKVSRFFISNKASTKEVMGEDPRLYYPDPRCGNNKLLKQFSWIPSDRVRMATKQDFTGPINHIKEKITKLKDELGVYQKALRNAKNKKKE